ncbi:MAG: phage repressor protein [Leptothrix sp. (in: Bacteria)]|nr:phage repressor protein [Leptothrix sp. (in: b-proteobacteria)]
MSCDCQAAPPPPRADEDDAGCSAGESFALRVLGDDMQPEFNEGDIIVIEPDGVLKDGSFVLARLPDDGWTFRQLCVRGDAWALHALNPARTDLVDVPLADLSSVHGLVIQKTVPGRRKLGKSYL